MYHPCVSLNKEKIYRDIGEHKIAVCEKTAGLRSGNSSDVNSACLTVLVPAKIFQIQDMLNETGRYRSTTDGLICFVDLRLPMFPEGNPQIIQTCILNKNFFNISIVTIQPVEENILIQ